MQRLGAREQAAEIGAELAELGETIALGLVADVVSEAREPVERHQVRALGA
jgi:hypothetical protein